ncbi:MAG: acyl-CoA synthetase [Mycobacteriales bacterium]
MTDLGVGSWPARRARISPHRVAFRQGDRAVTYAELAARVDALAAGLAGRGGVRPGDRVAYLGPNDLATFETFFAAGRLGAIFVPLNIRLAGPEIAYMLADCGARVLVYAPATAGLAAAADPRAAGVSTLVALDPSGDPAGALPYADLAATGPAAAVPDTPVDLGDDALILYTSGTTGRPKGAVLTHGNVTFNTMNQLAHVDVLSTDVVLCTAPLFHVTGLGQVSLPTLVKGGTVVIAPRFDPEWMLRAVGELRVNAFSAVPTMLQMLCEHPGWAAADLSSLRYVIYGGSPVMERVARAWQDRGIDVLQGYGMTEAAPGVLLAPPEGARERPTSAGVPHFFTDIGLVDPAGDAVAVPGTGELVVRGPHVFRGYWNRPADTADALRDGWFRSGDVVRVDADGWGTVVDRVKDVIISGGENVYPAEVEAVLAQLPEVAASAVIGVPDPRWGEVGYAFVVRQPGVALDEARLRAHLEGRLARYKIPRYLRFVDDLPRTASGKVRKAELRAAAPPPP